MSKEKTVYGKFTKPKSTGARKSFDNMEEPKPEPGDKVDTLEEGSTNLSDDYLIERCKEWIGKLCQTGGRAWSLSVPVDFKRDPDVLFGELIKRFQSLNK